jgi:hypothetical protein
MKRRDLLKASIALPLFNLVRAERAYASGGTAQRAIFFYFPDGVLGASQDGEPSLWHATGSETNFTLGQLLSPLEAWKDQCVFFNGLSMGPTDAGSHPGGAKKLLTGSDGGNGESIDQFLARTVGAQSAFHHLYLGAQADQNNASGDKHIVYSSAGQTVTPEDDPRAAFARVFSGGGTGVTLPTQKDLRPSIIDNALLELNALKQKLGTVEQVRLDAHVEALREVEQRIQMMPVMPASCGSVPPMGIADADIYDPGHYQNVLQAQMDLVVEAMACGQTKVATLQCSMHTSELLMSRIPNTDFYDPTYDMRSHQASHYGPAHDFTRREVAAFAKQITWFVQQFAYLLDALKKRPEGNGTMLDNTVLLLCTEICDGNTHGHDNMPFVLAGGAGGAIRTGRLLQFPYQRHSDLLIGIAHAMGQNITWFGDASSGPLPGLLG